jgi:raffinose/stachyose/melibiose transport system substrate-binding protein
MYSTVRRALLGLAAAAIAGSVAAQDLKLWSWRQEDRAVYAELIAAFEKANPGIKVNFEAFEAASYATVLSTALAGDTGPDLMMVRAYGAFEAVAGANYLLPLTTADVPGLAALPEAALTAQTLRADGKVYGVPFASQTMLVIYNRGLFNQLGLSVPQSWADLVATAEKIKASGKFPFANGTATAWQNETIVSALMSSTIGAAFFDDIRAGKTDFTDPRFVNGLEKLKEISRFFPDGFVGLDYASSQQLFASGLAAMFAGGSFEIANFLRQNPALDLGVFAAPGQAASDPKLVGLFFDGGYAGNAKTKHPEAVKKFLAYTATRDFAQPFANKLRNISPVPGVTLDDKLLQQVADLNKSSVPYIMLTNFRYQEPSGSVLLQAEVQKLLAGRTDAAAAAKAITAGIATYHKPFQK